MNKPLEGLEKYVSMRHLLMYHRNALVIACAIAF
jgi:hypothetical protein